MSIRDRRQPEGRTEHRRSEGKVPTALRGARSSLLVMLVVAGVAFAALAAAIVDRPAMASSSSPESVATTVPQATQAPKRPAPGRIAGTVLLLDRRGQSPARSVSAEDVVVYFTPDAPVEVTAKSFPARFEMATKDKTYTPSVVVVPRGREVHFPNKDQILHNVFSVSGENRFDLDLYDGGESRSRAFSQTGLVRVFCNVHRDMVGYIWVVDTPFVARPAATGKFAFVAVPTGPGTLTVWHERADPLEQRIVVDERGLPLDVSLRITRPRLPSHARKDGTSYRTRDKY